MTIPVDIPKVYTALAEWLSCLMVVLARRQKLRPSGRSAGVCIMAASLANLCVIQIICGTLTNAWWLVGMLTAVFFMGLTLYACLRLDFREVTYILARVFLWAEFTAALEWQLDRFYVPERWENSVCYSLIHCAAVYLLMFACFYAAERRLLRNNMDVPERRSSIGDLAAAWLTAIVFFTLSNLSYVAVPSPFRGSEMAQIFNIRTVYDFAGFIMLELFYIQKLAQDHREEMSAIRNVLHTQYMQFRQSQENADLINQKYHDLKHHLEVLKAMGQEGKSLAYIDEIERDIRPFEIEYDTGNAVLDTVLGSKGQLCLKNDIQLTVVADGALLKDIHVMDLASIFGNALDNAIEHEILIPERGKRMIRLSVTGKGRMTSILIENFFQGTLLKKGEEIMTSKADARYHGYGLRSIRHVVSKYGGIMTAEALENWFQLKILLPGNYTRTR